MKSAIFGIPFACSCNLASILHCQMYASVYHAIVPTQLDCNFQNQRRFTVVNCTQRESRLQQNVASNEVTGRCHFKKEHSFRQGQ